jgi:tetratricopeptide (TPR) repeat protein
MVVSEAWVSAALGDVEKVMLLADTLKNLPVGHSTVVSGLLQMGLELRVHGHAGASVTLLEDALAWAEDHPGIGLFSRARLLFSLQRYEEALPLWEEYFRENPTSPYLPYLALTLDGLGRTAQADSVMEAYDPAARDPWPALLAARRGDVVTAVRLLQANFDAEMPYYTTSQLFLHNSTLLEPIRDHDLFRALMRPTG